MEIHGNKTISQSLERSSANWNFCARHHYGVSCVNLNPILIQCTQSDRVNRQLCLKSIYKTLAWINIKLINSRGDQLNDECSRAYFVRWKCEEENHTRTHFRVSRRPYSPCSPCRCSIQSIATQYQFNVVFFVAFRCAFFSRAPHHAFHIRIFHTQSMTSRRIRRISYSTSVRQKILSSTWYRFFSALHFFFRSIFLRVCVFCWLSMAKAAVRICTGCVLGIICPTIHWIILLLFILCELPALFLLFLCGFFSDHFLFFVLVLKTKNVKEKEEKKRNWIARHTEVNESATRLEISSRKQTCPPPNDLFAIEIELFGLLIDGRFRACVVADTRKWLSQSPHIINIWIIHFANRASNALTCTKGSIIDVNCHQVLARKQITW